jgi:GAF domain-containing protein
VGSTRGADGSAASAAVLAESLRKAAARKTPEESLRAGIAMAVGTAPCDQASITMLGPGRTVETVASSDGRITKADMLQYEEDEGPCLDAVWTNGVFEVPDLAADARWPRWTARAADLGIGGLLAVHLYTDTALGALNLYSERPRVYDDTDLEAARIVAAHASVVLAYTRKTQDLWRAIDTRNLIGQAQGMLMAQYKLTPDTAFAVLRRYSQATNVRLAELAEELTSTGQLPELDVLRARSDGSPHSD